MNDNTVLSQVLSEQVSKMQKSLDEFSRVCSNAIDVYTQSNEDLISREAVLDLSYWHGERETYDNPMPDGVEAVDVEDIIKLPSLAKLTHEPTAGDCWGCNCPKMNTEPIQQTIEPERKKGRWVFVRKVSPVYNYQGVKLWGNEYRCSCCGYRDMAIENFKSCAFCPNCGMEMEVE